MDFIKKVNDKNFILKGAVLNRDIFDVTNISEEILGSDLLNDSILNCHLSIQALYDNFRQESQDEEMCDSTSMEIREYFRKTKVKVILFMYNKSAIMNMIVIDLEKR